MGGWLHEAWVKVWGKLEFKYEFIVVRDLFFWTVTLLSILILHMLLRVAGAADWVEVYWGMRASIWIITVFYLMKLVRDLWGAM